MDVQDIVVSAKRMPGRSEGMSGRVQMLAPQARGNYPVHPAIVTRLTIQKVGTTVDSDLVATSGQACAYLLRVPGYSANGRHGLGSEHRNLHCVLPAPTRRHSAWQGDGGGAAPYGPRCDRR